MFKSACSKDRTHKTHISFGHQKLNYDKIRSGNMTCKELFNLSDMDESTTNLISIWASRGCEKIQVTWTMVDLFSQEGLYYNIN